VLGMMLKTWRINPSSMPCARAFLKSLPEDGNEPLRKIWCQSTCSSLDCEESCEIRMFDSVNPKARRELP
jgi:hypothetical protein